MHEGRARQVELLFGFCLLVQRDTFNKIGGLDTGYGPGFFEDVEFCLKLRRAGHKLALAQDVFVHHAGHASFKANGLGIDRQHRDNYRRFKRRWGDHPRINPAVENSHLLACWEQGKKLPVPPTLGRHRKKSARLSRPSCWQKTES